MLFLSIQLSVISLGKWGKHLHSARSTENAKESVSDMAWLGGQKFSGGTKIFSTIVEKFYPRIKIFGGTIFFLTGPQLPKILYEIVQSLKFSKDCKIVTSPKHLLYATRDVT